MESNLVAFLVDYMKKKTSPKKPITNNEIDFMLQNELGTKPIADAGIRALIHYIRVNVPIKNENNEEGWICASADGYYLTFDPIHILQHLESYEGKIHKMMLVRKKGYEILERKVYYKQSKIKFE